MLQGREALALVRSRFLQRCNFVAVFMEESTSGAKRPRAAEAPRFFSIFQKRGKTGKAEQNPSAAAAGTTIDKMNASPRQIFCDLDGVLVDFEAGVTLLRDAYNAKAKQQPPFNIWKSLRQAPRFYRTLPWMKDGKELWAAIAPLQPHILTGVPWGHSEALDKFEWCQEELTLPSSQPWKWRNMVGPKKTHVLTTSHVPKVTKTTGSTTTDHAAMPLSTSTASTTGSPTIITCWSKNKPLECRSAGDILIDDRPEAHDLRVRWEQAGGIFIHHTSAHETIRALVELGVVPENGTKKAKK